jgi:hypothetical protein
MWPGASLVIRSVSRNGEEFVVRKSMKVVMATAVLGTVMTMPGHADKAAAGVTARYAAAGTGCLEGADFNGDGCGDQVVGDPAATVGGRTGAGRINAIYGNRTGAWTTALLTQGQAGVGDTAEAGDGFGGIVAASRLNDDGYTDLVVAVPGESVGSAEDAGVIQVIFGSANGLGAGRAPLLLRQGVFGIAGGPEAGDRFGAAMRANTTDPSGDIPAPAIAYGAPGEDLGSVADAGRAGMVLFGPNGTVAAAGAVDQDSPGISGAVEAGDRFGQSVDLHQGPSGFSCPVSGTRGWTLAVGVPGEDFGTTRDAGMVHMIKDLAGDTLLSQDTAGVDGAPEAGDRFGAAMAMKTFCEHDGPSHVRFVVGTPGEDIGTVADAGMIHYFRADDDDEAALPHRWSAHQDTTDVADQSEAADQFGSVLGFGGFRDDLGEAIVVGMPSEDVGTVTDSGAVQVFGDAVPPGNGDLLITQARFGEPVQAGDRFGVAIAARSSSLQIGVPDDVTHASGVVHGFPWDNSPILRLVPGQDGIPTGAARFGASLG